MSIPRYPVMLPVPYWMDRGSLPHLKLVDDCGLNFLWFSAEKCAREEDENVGHDGNCLQLASMAINKIETLQVKKIHFYS